MFRTSLLACRLCLALALVLAGIAAAPVAQAAQPYPSRPITIIVGYSAGGANDILARIVADKMSSILKQSIIVENKPGVASIIGATYVAKAPADGYTLLMGASGPISFNPSLYKSLPYSPDKDLTPISLVGTFPLLLLTQASNPATATVPGLIEYSKAHPEAANYSASAASFQLITELFKNKTNSNFVYVPYKGSADSITAVARGDTAMTLVDSGPGLAAVNGGRVRALAVTSAERMPYLPDVPTMRELGLDLDVQLWSGLFAPANTPREVIATLQQAVQQAITAPEVKQRIAALSITPTSSAPDALAAQVTDEIALWKKVATEAGIQPN